MRNTVVILGSGISGLSAGYHLKENDIPNVIYEKDSDWGGLCSNFIINGFRFDKFVHLSFTKEDYVKEIFAKSTPFVEHQPLANNYYKGYWLKHPAQNNLYPLPEEEKNKIIDDFKNRKQKEVSKISDYADWLECQYGNYFAHNFPFAYTRKYWGKEPKQLETKWVGERMYSPSLEEVMEGSQKEVEKNFYYASSMRYPEKGGYKSFFNGIREGLDIKFNKEVAKINPDKKEVIFSDGTKDAYSKLISSLPLPEIVRMIENVPDKVLKAASDLKYTSGYMVSLGLNRADVAKDLWFYIYDEDILSARVYSPSIKSKDNVPSGCSSIQAEVFFANDSEILPQEVVLENTINKLSEIYSFSKDEIVVNDIRFEKYANVIFDHKIYENRKVVLDYLKSTGIKTIGRFGKWEYLWSDQAFLSGKEAADELV